MTHELATQLLANPISPKHLLGSYGLVGLVIILFAECGLLVGFFLPGDTLLFSAGLLIAIDDPSINLPRLPVVLVALPIAAITGNLVGYWIGYKAGPKVFDRPRSRLFRPEYVIRSQAFFDRFGRATVILARFVPVVRTVATVLAGVGRMRFGLYALYSMIGGMVWTDGMLLLGRALGHIKFVRDTVAPKIDLILITVVVLSLLPTAVHWWRPQPTLQPLTSYCGVCSTPYAPSWAPHCSKRWQAPKVRNAATGCTTAPGRGGSNRTGRSGRYTATPRCSSEACGRCCCSRCIPWRWPVWPGIRVTAAIPGGGWPEPATSWPRPRSAPPRTRRRWSTGSGPSTTRSRGTAPDGRPYAASDPHLLRWVHLAEVDSFLGAHQRYGARPLDEAGCDGYVADTARVAAALGVRDPPTT